MTRSKKLLAFLLALIMVMSLTACSAFDVEALKAVKQLEDLDSLRADIDVSIGVKAMGFLSMDFSMIGTADITTDPSRAKAGIGLDLGMLGEAMNMEIYCKKDGEKTLTAVSQDGGQTWSQSEANVPTFNPSDLISVESIKALASFADSFREHGTETVKGTEAKVYAGNIKWSEIMAMVEDPTVLEEANEALGTDLSKMEFDIPVTVCLDESTNMIVKFTLDLTGMMKTLLPLALQKAAEADVGLDSTTAQMLESLNFDNLFITVILYDFNQVGEIVIPAGVFQD